MTDPMIETQRQLEDGLKAEGIQRFQQRLERAKRDLSASTEGAGRKLFAEALLKVEPAVRRYVETAGNKAVAAKWVKKVGVEKAAYVACRVVLDHIYTEVSTRKLALKMAEMLIDELRFRKLEREAPGLFKYKAAKFCTDHYGYKKAVLSQAVRWSEVDISEYETSEKTRLHIGAALLSIFVQETGLVEHVSVRVPRKGSRGVKQSDTVRPTEETREWLRHRNEWLEDMFPTHAPMVVAPLPWGREPIPCPECQGYPLRLFADDEWGTNTHFGCSRCNATGAVGETSTPGGYMFGLKGTVPLIRGMPSALRKEVEASVGPMVLRSLNNLQYTGWRVNRRVLEVVEQALISGGEVAGLPGMEPEPLPAKPKDIEANEDARREWRRKAAEVHERNRTETGQRFEALKAASLAKQYSEYEAFYFVWNLDFRGRCYPVADILQPQGSDVSRGLLEFANGVSLGQDGGWWLMVHGANCLGQWGDTKVSHLTLEERVELIDRNGPVWCQVARDPWANPVWQEADDPWQFLAFCFEYAAWCATGQDEGFISHLVCHVDGTANGLQHFAALLRDEAGADAVNMTVRQEPSDIYQRVAEAMVDLLWQETGEDKVLANLWLDTNSPVPLDRKLVKRPTMTSAYGSGRYGFSDQLLHYLRNEMGVEAWRATRKHFMIEEKEVYGAACRYMAGIIWRAIGHVVSSAFEGMSWLQKGSREFTKQGKLTTWTVPVSGMKVIQPYVDYDSIQVRTAIAGQAWVPRSYQPILNKPVAHEQANGVSPNFIHSLDAVALHMTVVRACSGHGVHAFAAIHDSFGSHAGSMSEVSHVLRVAFVDLHTLPIMSDLRDEWTHKHGLTLDELPPSGRYEVSEVMSADYFFC